MVGDPLRYPVLLCFCAHSFMQCFVFMDFSTVETLAEHSLNMTGSAKAAEVGLLYYGGFAATLPSMLVALWLMLHGYDRAAGRCMSLLIVMGSWLRLYAAIVHSYAGALASTILLGCAGGVIFTSFTFLPERWFPDHERGFATALAVQSNYAGWAVGALNPAMFGGSLFGGMAKPTEQGLRRFLVVQAIVVSFLLPLHLMTNWRAPRSSSPDGASPGANCGSSDANCGHSAGSAISHPGNEVQSPASLSAGATASMLIRRPQYMIHSLCYAMLGAVGYAVTGVMNECLSAASIAFTAHETMWLNFAFIASGVFVGLLTGRYTPFRRYSIVIKSLFLTGAVSLLCVQLLLIAGRNGVIRAKATLLPLLVLLMILAGAGTLGFTSLGLRIAVHESRPALELYSGSIIEFFLLGISCILGLLSYVLPPENTFWFFALPAGVACGVIFCCARFPQAEDLYSEHGLLARPDNSRTCD